MKMDLDNKARRSNVLARRKLRPNHRPVLSDPLQKTDQQQLLRMLIDNIPDYIFIKDAEGRFVIVNDTVRRYFDVPRFKDVIGHKDEDFFPPELARNYREDDLQVMQTNTPLINNEEQMQNSVTKKFKWVLTTKVPLCDADGNVIGVIGIARDIDPLKRTQQDLEQAQSNLEEQIIERTTDLLKVNAALQREIEERRLAQAALVAEHNVLRTIIDNMPDYIYVKDQQSRFVLGNKAIAANMGASSPDDLIGKSDFDFYPHQDVIQFYQDEQEIFATGKPLINHEEMVFDHTKQSKEWVLTTKVPFRDEAGNIAGIVGIGRNISFLKRSEEQTLELAVKHERLNILEEFIGNLSHDLKSPLTIIKNNLYLFEKLSGDSPHQKHIETAKQQTILLEKFIQDILTISRLDNEALYVTYTVISIQTILNDIKHRFSSIAQERGINLVFDIEENAPNVFGNRVELDRVFLNLVENALTYTPAGGTVTVHTASNGEYTLIDVIDDGIGISAEDLPKIFERFYRADKARSNTSSTGLGLAIVKAIIDLHAGRIEVTSTPDVGSRFRVILPVQKMPSASTLSDDAHLMC